MEDILDTDEMIKRFKDRAAAVKKRDLPPVGGEERQRFIAQAQTCLLYTSPSPRDISGSRMPSSA